MEIPPWAPRWRDTINLPFQNNLSPKKVLICGSAGFIGRNLLNHFLGKPEYEVYAAYHRIPPLPGSFSNEGKVKFVKVDLTDKRDVDEVTRGMDIVIQAAATTSGAKEILSKPYYHVTDNAVMNALIFRACYENKVRRLIFFSCTVMYPGHLGRPVKEDDFDYQVNDKYFGSGWTKVYAEKMCEFYSRIGPTQYMAIRHSNVYGPFDKYDLERSHVFGATVTKVMTAPENGKIVVWGDGSEERDLIHVDDLIAFIDKILLLQGSPFELINVGRGESISVRSLIEKIVKHSGKSLVIEFDRTKPNIPFKLSLNIERAKTFYQWEPRISLDEGIAKTLEWYRSYYLQSQGVS